MPTRLRLACLLLGVFASVTILGGQAPKKGGAKKRTAPGEDMERPSQKKFAPTKLGDPIAGERVSDAGKQSDWPAMCYAADGSLYSLFIEWNDKDADRVMLRRRAPSGQWAEPAAIDDGNWDHFSPAIAARKSGSLAVWSGQSTTGNYDLFASRIAADGKASKAERITSAPAGDILARAASDAEGNVTVVWQSFRNGNADVYARKLTGDTWGPEVKISESPSSDWEPAVAVDPRGVAWISWDTYHAGNYDVMLRSFDGRKAGPMIAITTSAKAEFHTSIAADAEGKIWVAWDEADQNWGKDFSTSSRAPGSNGLHYSRRIGIRVYANGRVQEPAADLAKVLTGRMEQYAELPHLAFDGAGALTMIFRHWTSTQPNEIYHFYATRLEGGEWTTPQQLATSSGHNSQHASIARNAAGALSAVYSSDGRSETNLPKEQLHAMHYNVYLSALPSAAAPAKTPLRDVTLEKQAVRGPLRPRSTMTAGGKKYTVLMGDAHRHTDIRGHNGVDGSIADTYRYAIDAAQLDWLGVSDHNEVLGGRWPDGLRDYQWWYTQKYVDLMTHGPTFTGMYSYEHSMARPAGHRNVLFLKRGAPLRPIDRNNAEDNLPPNMWKWWEANVLTQPGQKSVIVPHTFAAGPLADWNWPNARFDCLLEMYQGARGSYEAYQLPDGEIRGGTQVDEGGHYAQDALAKGNTYGFVSFSDHASTHNSWAAIWVADVSRRGIIDGMYDRRTYAASDEMILRVTADGHMPGEEWTTPAGRAPVIQASVEAPDTILRIDIVKDGKYVYTVRPGARKAAVTWRDSEPKAGRSYYYVRVFQRDTEKPDGDPEIGWASPFYVTYR